jgi:undecaprenyl-diphosphatase
MGWLESIVLGIVQGLTEFLPISSSAHQLVVGRLFWGGDPGAAFTAVTQLGTETAVFIYFFKDIVRIIQHWVLSIFGKIPRSDPDARMGWLVIVGSIPIGILGYLFQDAIETYLRNMWITVSMLFGVGIVLLIADRFAVKHAHKDLEDLSWRDGLLFGLFQAAALIPGVSRSGGTSSGGLFLGYNREAATRYSFLLAIPAVFISGFYELRDIGSDTSVAWGPTIVATVIAGVIGFAMVAWILRYISTHDFRPFVWYRIIIAIVIAVLLATGLVPAELPLS